MIDIGEILLNLWQSSGFNAIFAGFANGGWQNLVDPAARDKQTLALLDALVDWQKEDKLFENQQLLKQPIVRNGRQATVGYQPDVWAAWQ